ncbi:type I-F CRISPR-associated endoribonuclease Cas6/Csy4 [Phocoenobacter skyensis]|uniref:CRISPR-associated endonuclease Csy4 n=1 Tax=Phocoenobacter skyensis TaxID=97481 RepID=A0A1H7W5G6_9PAST|nr:type I-F CRISPR-associated endoribonuclease Cas6/Csy4 [Pasteurella skyensis]MDP8079120.1 type I-F CRISPR-associated endoribonuclease Cas6/Csy4 [Pasteurella skyensis]MDP8085070.1 type I-F CRISPR-associated endoribonuclease Cas6/Csy4 [Pasteurella skyensis]MDP8163023.1 type I-F CRISPR-associated endoribonuclease Cas6/Csy4 [Pasteurella skyensis]MDP8173169.1 type I-F CRISPR-associated endoribonuclease Cas6/Csy4 [Pasteurella skyensis]MDP8176391.1 type I-F CRISPR-associated endoribonuclease Cas6/C
MNYYQEVTLIKNADISLYFIWSKAFTQLHLALVEQAKKTNGESAETSNIGVSFPEYRCFEKEGKTVAILGSKLRIFAHTEQELEQLDFKKWLERLADYVHCSSIKAVPEQVSYICVKRFRQEKNRDRQIRRYAKRHNKTFDEVKAERIAQIMQQENLSREKALILYYNPPLELRPYIKLKSESNQNEFSLQIEQIDVDTYQSGKFNTYGLSSTTTVPNW